MIGRILALAIGLVVGLAASQLPEFAQQYRQRLGGAIDELRRVAERFDESAQASGLSRDDAVRRLSSDPAPLVRDQGQAIGAVTERLDRLQRQRAAFATVGPFARVLQLARNPDPTLMRATYLDYEPAWPATTEGVAAGGIGFVAGWLASLFLARTTRRLVPWRRRGSAGRLRSA